MVIPHIFICGYSSVQTLYRHECLLLCNWITIEYSFIFSIAVQLILHLLLTAYYMTIPSSSAEYVTLFRIGLYNIKFPVICQITFNVTSACTIHFLHFLSKNHQCYFIGPPYIHGRLQSNSRIRCLCMEFHHTVLIRFTTYRVNFHFISKQKNPRTSDSLKLIIIKIYSKSHFNINLSYSLEINVHE